VNEISLLSHKIVHKKDYRPNEILSKNNTEIDESGPEAEKVSIRSVLSKKTHRQFFSDELRPEVEHNWQNRAVAYVGDSSTLVPQVTNKIVKTLVESAPSSKNVDIPINLVESEKVVVKDVSHHNHREHLAFTPLPEILLSGELNISDLDSTADYEEPEPVTFEDLPKSAQAETPFVSKISRYEKPVRLSAQVPDESTVASAKVAARFVQNPLPAPVSSLVAPVSPRVSVSPVVVESPKTKVRSFALLVLPLVIILAVLATGLSLAFSSVTVYEGGVSRTTFSFHSSSLGEALLYLAK
jgi:hypothetical protein